MLPRIDCPHCGTDVERRPFCGACGQPIDDPLPQSPSATPPRWRGLRNVTPSVGGLVVFLRRRSSVSIASAGLLLVVITLLVNEAGLALVIVAAAATSIVIARFRAVNLFEDEPARAIATVALCGLIAGLVISMLSDIVVDQLWLDGATFNVGAAGFGGSAAEAAGRPPFALIALVGTGLPLLGVVLMMLGPLLYRRMPAYRNEVLDGLTLGSSAGAGFAVASTAVYFLPLITGDLQSRGTVAEWTATVLGVSVVRPLVVTLSASLLGAALWQYGLSRRVRDTLRYAIPGFFGVVAFTVIDLLIQPSGTTVELGWVALSLVIVGVSARRDLAAALWKDHASLGTGTGRVRCPRCHSVTPEGTFCARCGAALHHAQDGVAARFASEQPSTHDSPPQNQPIQ